MKAKVRSAAVGLLVASAITLFVPPAGAAPAWQPATVAVPGIGFDGGDLFAWGDGEAAVLWHTISPRGFPFLTEMVSFRLGAGAAWSATALVERESTYDGVGANDAGEIVRAWWGSDSNLEVWTKPANSHSWYRQLVPVATPDVRRVPGSPLHGEPEVAVGPGGDVVVVWGFAVDCPAKCLYRLHAIVRPAGSSTWSPETEIAPDTKRSGIPAHAAVDRAGNALVVWVRYPIPGPLDVVRAAVRPAGGPWQPAIDVAGGERGSAAGLPSLAMDGDGHSVIAWAGCCVRSTRGVFAAFRSAGSPGSAPAVLSSDADATPRALIDASGDALVSWVGRTATHSSTYTRSSRRWTRPALITQQGWEGAPASRADAIAMARTGKAVAAWSVGSTLRTALKPSDSTTWTDPITIATNYERGARLAFDAEGHALAVWSANHADADIADLYSSNLGGNGPVLTSFSVPPHAQVGQRVRLSVKAFPWDAPLVGRPRWTFGDGSSARGATVSHTYRRRGHFAVTVRALDATGGATTASATVPILRRQR